MHVSILTQIGNSVGTNRPREIDAKLGTANGVTSNVVDQLTGVHPTVAEPHFAAQMDIVRRVMTERWAVLRELAQ
jgi:hypothetical protein